MIIIIHYWCDQAGEGAPLYKSYLYVPLQSLWFLGPFGLKTGREFAHFDLESNKLYGFRGNYRSVWKYLLFQFQMNKKEKMIIYVNSKWILRNLFGGVLILVEARYENGYGFYRLGLKIGVENDIFWAWNRVRIWRTRWQIPTKNSQKYHPSPTHSPTQPKLKSCHIASFLLFYRNSKVFSFLKRDLARTDNSPPKKASV